MAKEKLHLHIFGGLVFLIAILAIIFGVFKLEVPKKFNKKTSVSVSPLNTEGATPSNSSTLVALDEKISGDESEWAAPLGSRVTYRTIVPDTDNPNQHTDQEIVAYLPNGERKTLIPSARDRLDAFQLEGNELLYFYRKNSYKDDLDSRFLLLSKVCADPSWGCRGGHTSTENPWMVLFDRKTGDIITPKDDAWPKGLDDTVAWPFSMSASGTILAQATDFSTEPPYDTFTVRVNVLDLSSGKLLLQYALPPEVNARMKEIRKKKSVSAEQDAVHLQWKGEALEVKFYDPEHPVTQSVTGGGPGFSIVFDNALFPNWEKKIDLGEHTHLVGKSGKTYASEDFDFINGNLYVKAPDETYRFLHSKDAFIASLLPSFYTLDNLSTPATTVASDVPYIFWLQDIGYGHEILRGVMRKDTLEFLPVASLPEEFPDISWGGDLFWSPREDRILAYANKQKEYFVVDLVTLKVLSRFTLPDGYTWCDYVEYIDSSEYVNCMLGNATRWESNDHIIIELFQGEEWVVRGESHTPRKPAKILDLKF